MQGRVVVSGASSGIGRAVAQRYAAEGWAVCATARREERLRELLAELPGADHLYVAGDYAEPETASRIGAVVAERWGRLDALVNCAGIFLAADPITTPLAEWRRPLDIMLDGAIHLTRMAVPLMADGGRIVHVTSIHGSHAEGGSSAYAMAKAAIDQYCRALAVDLAPRGILVNAIAPGFVATPMSVIDGDPIGLWVRGQYEYEEGVTIRAQWVTGYFVVVAGKPDRDNLVVRLTQIQTLNDCVGDACENPQNLYCFNNVYVLAETPLYKPFYREQWYKLAVEVRGPRTVVWLDDEKVIDYVDTKEPFLKGTVGFKTHETWTASFDDLIVTPLY